MTRIFTGSRAAEYLMQYYWDTMDSMVPADTVLHALRIAGFTDVKQKVLLSVFTEYSALKPQ
jgi:demethylmenaquinone methyltransferase/2-methoxy-6-polyprenyl-1,4-benzoquinol methylase